VDKPASTSRSGKSNRWFLNTTEMERLLEASKKGRYGVRDFAMCKLLIRHAFRASELCGLQMSDLLLENASHAEIQVNRSKGSHSMLQPCKGHTLRALNAWLKQRPADTGFGNVFLTERRAPLTRNSLYYLVKEWGERAMIPFTVHPHMLRHTTGYVMANLGTDFRTMQDLLGHKNPRHTALYTRLDRRQYEKVWGDF